MAIVKELDHIVLRSPDQEKSLAFYCDVLGMEGVRVEEWRAGTVNMPSVRVNAGTIIDIFARDKNAQPETPRPEVGEGSARSQVDHFCLVLQPDVDQDDLIAAIENAGYKVGMRSSRFGARADTHGRGESFYFTGPEGVMIELRQYPGDRES